MALDNQLVTLGARIEERRREIGISQAELARRVGVRQSTMNSLIKGDSRTTRSLLKIARELRTTPAYLTGEVDNPDEGAPQPPPAAPYQAITLQVLLPGEAALAQMFEGMLAQLDPAHPDEHALLLAQRLPSALAQLKDLLPAQALVADATPRRRRPTPVAAPPS